MGNNYNTGDVASRGVRKVRVDAVVGHTDVSGTWTFNFSTGGQYGGAWLQSPNNVGDAASWQVWLDAGTWQLDTFLWKQVNAGTITVKLDGVLLQSIDAYDGSGVNVQTTATGVSVVSSGYHTLRVDVTGTNHANQNVYVECFDFSRTA